MDAEESRDAPDHRADRDGVDDILLSFAEVTDLDLLPFGKRLQVRRLTGDQDEALVVEDQLVAPECAPLGHEHADELRIGVDLVNLPRDSFRLGGCRLRGVLGRLGRLRVARLGLWRLLVSCDRGGNDDQPQEKSNGDEAASLKMLHRSLSCSFTASFDHEWPQPFSANRTRPAQRPLLASRVARTTTDSLEPFEGQRLHAMPRLYI